MPSMNWSSEPACTLPAGTPKLRYTNSDIGTLFHDTIVKEIVALPIFKRLLGISFLGAIDTLPAFKNQRQNRFDHSIGVALLAQYACEKLDVTDKERRSAVIAGLLHDIGHAPFSHSVEPVFARRFGINHHLATAMLIKGQHRAGQELFSLLSINGIDADEILSLCSARENTPIGRLFSSRLNIDTLEAIWRTASYLGKKFCDPFTIVDAAIRCHKSDIQTLDDFWTCKGHVYKVLIYGDEGAAADLSARSAVESNIDKIEKDDFFLSENRLSKKIGKPGTKITHSGVINTRDFFIDLSVPLTSQDDFPNRYLYRKSKRDIRVENFTLR